MKILLTGGGTGGHFYPIIAVSEELRMIAREHRIADLELYYMSPTPYNAGILYNNRITFLKTSAGKARRYFSILNFFDLFKTAWGVIKSTWEIFTLYPDVIFGKGGYASFPALFAAKILRIPVVIHESDSVPGRVNTWAGKFAERVAVSYPEAGEYFHKEKVAYTGNPIRKDIVMALTTNAHAYLNLKPEIPTILIIGGSQGSQIMNEGVLEALPKLLENYQVIHQTGKNNLEEVRKITDAIILDPVKKERYHMYDYLDSLTLRSAAGAADIIISRAGSSIFEIASWGIPAIIIPITNSNGNHQVKNAFAYARTGAAVVVREENLTGNIISAEVDRILGNDELRASMKEASKQFVKPEAARLIAEELMKIALRHEIKQ